VNPAAKACTGGAIVAAALGLLPACHRATAPAPGEPAAYRLHILCPPAMDPARFEAVDCLRERFAGARTYPEHDAWIAASRALREGGVLVIPDADFYPVNRIEWLDSFIASGGRLLLVGPRPFSVGVVQSGRRMLCREEYAVALAREAAAWLPPPGRWPTPAGNLPGEEGVEFQTARDGPEHWECQYLLWHGGPREWEILATIPEQYRAVSRVLFHACARGRGTRLVFLLGDDRGRWWGRELVLEPAWKLYTVTLPEMEEAAGMDPARIRRCVLGIRPPEAERDTRVGISELRLCRDPLLAEQYPDTDPWGLRELARLPVTSGGRIELALGTGRAFRVRGEVGLMPGVPAGWGDCRRVSRRVEGVVGTSGCLKGSWAGAVIHQKGASGRGTKWGWLGIRLAAVEQDTARELLEPLLKALTRRVDILAAGIGRLAVRPGESLSGGLLWDAAPARRAGTVRAAVSLSDASGRIRDRWVGGPGDGFAADARSPAAFALKAPTTVSPLPQELRLECEIADIRRGPQPVDCLVQPLLLMSQPVPAESRPEVRGGGFALGRWHLVLLGVRLAREEESRRLLPEWFDPDAFESDLQQIAEAGFNAIVVPLTGPRAVPQVHYLGELARRRGLWLIVEIPALNPLRPDIRGAAALLRALDPARVPALLAIQVCAAEGGDLTPLASYWSRWLGEQFGSADRAEKLWGALPLTGARQSLRKSPLFGRFLADWSLRECAWLRGCLRRLGFRGWLALGLQAEVPPMWNAGLMTGGRLADFIVLHGDLFPRIGRQRMADALWLGRGMSGGRPVCLGLLWSPRHGWRYSTPAAMEKIFRYAAEQHAAGVFLPRLRSSGGLSGPAVLDAAGMEPPWVPRLCAILRKYRVGWTPPPAERGVGVNPWEGRLTLSELARLRRAGRGTAATGMAVAGGTGETYFAGASAPGGPLPARRPERRLDRRAGQRAGSVETAIRGGIGARGRRCAAGAAQRRGLPVESDGSVAGRARLGDDFGGGWQRRGIPAGGVRRRPAGSSLGKLAGAEGRLAHPATDGGGRTVRREADTDLPLKRRCTAVPWGGRVLFGPLGGESGTFYAAAESGELQ